MGMLRQLTNRATLQSFGVMNFSDWPEWLKVLVLVPHGILASVACWLWWPKSEKGWRKFGFVYLIIFFLVMRFVFQMKDFK